MKSLTTKSNDISPLESAMIQNDLSKLSAFQRAEFYVKVCQSVGLNHLTNPFGYIVFKDGKMHLYAKKDCTDQLRAIHSISIEVTKQEKVGDTYVVNAKAYRPDGRFDEDIGAVHIGKLTGVDLSNGYMKAITKAKRRVTLSICGLGFLDESEISSIKDAKVIDQPIESLPSQNQLTPAESRAILNSPEPLEVDVDDCEKIKGEILELLERLGEEDKATAALKFIKKNHDNPKELNRAKIKLMRALDSKLEGG
jgi:hypothetical protein